MGSFVIYKITNKLNGNFYIGMTNNFIKRTQQHKRSKSDVPISNAINKYGKENFCFEIIDSDAISYGYLKQLEIWYIEQLQPQYNITKGGNGTLGFKHKKETIIKMKISAKKSKTFSSNKGMSL